LWFIFFIFFRLVYQMESVHDIEKQIHFLNGIVKGYYLGKKNIQLNLSSISTKIKQLEMMKQQKELEQPEQPREAQPAQPEQ